MTIQDSLWLYFTGYIGIMAVIASIVFPIWLLMRLFNHPDAD